MRPHLLRPLPLAVTLMALLAPSAHAQASLEHRQWIAPTTRAQAFAARSTVTVTALEARVRIDRSVARTALHLEVSNPADRPAEAELLLPVPRGAVVDGFDFQGTGAAPSARLLPADEARRTYDEIVARLRDPALLEFVGTALVRSSVFPVPARGTQAIVVRYHEILPADGARVDYELLRTGSLGATVPLRLELEVDGANAAVYSPTHPLTRVEQGPSGQRYRVAPGDLEAGSFRCSVLRGEGPRAALYACPDAEGPGGTFLLFAGAPPRSATAPVLAREVTFVLDRSGSMGGEKFEQARQAALQVLEGLRPEERFRIVDYADTASTSSAAPQPKTPETLAAARAYLAGLSTGGGTNIAAALELALGAPRAPDTVPVVLFLTDGRPTVGPTHEAELHALLSRANTAERRLFAFGVGNDVNAPLLDRLASASRATSTYVRPGQDVEQAVGGLFQRLAGPVMAGLELRVLGPEGAEDTTTVRDVLPRELPDLYAGGELVVLGRYTAARPLTLEIRARDGAPPFRITTDLARADLRNDFVPRLWATRRIGELTDAIRQRAGSGAPEATLLADADTRELSDEILRLSLRHGVLSEFSAFLAREGSDLAAWNELSTLHHQNLVVENARQRSGAWAVNVARNNGSMQSQGVQNMANAQWTADDERTAILDVQATSQGALFRRSREWVEGSLYFRQANGQAPRPDEVVVIGSPEHRRLVDELAADGRIGVVSSHANALFQHRGRVVRQVPFAEPEPAPQPAPQLQPEPQPAPVQGQVAPR